MKVEKGVNLNMQNMCWKNLTKFKVFLDKQKGEDDGMAW